MQMLGWLNSDPQTPLSAPFVSFPGSFTPNPPSGHCSQLQENAWCVRAGLNAVYTKQWESKGQYEIHT